MDVVELYKEAFKSFLLETELTMSIPSQDIGEEANQVIDFLGTRIDQSNIGEETEFHITATNRKNPKHKCYFSVTGRRYWPVFDEHALSTFLTYLVTKQYELLCPVK